MKLHFEPDLDYQHTAIEAVCDLFRGQEICRTEFTVVRDPADPQMRMGFAESDLGIGNRLHLLDEEVLHNLNEIQLRNGLRPSETLTSENFTVEMETGTGKTYVYLRTIFELNKRYGFAKFVIVVPSVAIKEGVYKSLQMMKVTIDEKDIELPDVLTDLQDKTQLTRRSLARILIDSGRLNDFKRNPQHFIEIAAEAINRTRRLALVDGIRYQRIGDDVYYAQELFEQHELTGYLKNMLPSTKSVYEDVVYDLGGEETFATKLEANNAIKVYAKLPGWFKVPTPLGTYNPDWAVLVETDGAERLYFVVETKSSLFADDLRTKEAAKIKCGKAHFEALEVRETPAEYVVARTVDDLMSRT